MRPVWVLLQVRAVRQFLELAIEDMQTGRESWRVLALLSTIALGVSALYVW